MFALLLVTCVGLTVAYYMVFKDAAAIQGPTLRLHASGAVFWGRKGDVPRTEGQITESLGRALTCYRIACDEEPDKIEIESSCDWRNPYGPPVTLVVDPDATHGVLDSLLHTCVDAGFERFVMLDASGHRRSFSFVLFKDRPLVGLPDPQELPPVKLTLRAGKNGRLSCLKLNAKRLPDYAALRRFLDGILGTERGPDSVQAWLEIHMDCDPHLKVRHVLDAGEAMAGYTTKDGEWVSLVACARPVRWGDGWAELDWSVCDIEFEVDVDVDVDVP